MAKKTAPETESKNPKVAKDDFEGILEKLGGFGRYQIRLVLLLMPICTFSTYMLFSPVMFLFVPDHWCKADPSFQTSNLSLEQIRALTVPENKQGGHSQCQLKKSYFDNGQVVNNSQFYSQPCPFGWHYNFTNFFITAATDMNWVCTDAWKGPLTQTLFSGGLMVGTVLFGYISDHYGRLKTVYGSAIIMTLSGLITPFCLSFTSFSFIRFVMGMSFNSLSQNFLLLVSEFVPPRYRATACSSAYAIGYTLGSTHIPWLLKYIGDWKPWLHILFLQPLIMTLYPCFVDESYRWLASKGKKKECLESLEHVAKVNGKVLPITFKDTLDDIVEEKAAADAICHTDWSSLFKSRVLCKNVIVITLFGAGSLLMFDGHIRNISNFKASFFTIYTISCLTEVPANLIVFGTINALGRRWLSALSHFLAAVGMIICALVQDTSSTLVLVLVILCRLWTNCAIIVSIQFQMEIFPTPLRSQGCALVTVVSSAFLFTSPYIAFTSHFNPVYPFWILGLGGLVVAILPLLLPETTDKMLPDTIAEAEDLGKGESFWSMPICLQRQKKSQYTTLS